MLLCADLYLSKGEAGDGGLQKALSLYMRKNFPKSMHIPAIRTLEPAAVLQPVSKQALHVADFLAAHFELDYRNKDHLFTPVPWTHPGSDVVITESVILLMQVAASKAA